MEQSDLVGLSLLPLIVVLIAMAIPVIIIVATPRHLKVTRTRYWTVVGILFVLGLFQAGLEDSIAESNEAATLAIVLALITIATGLYFVRLTVGRLQDAAYSRWFTLLIYLPFANLVATVVIGILKPRDSGDVDRLQEVFK